RRSGGFVDLMQIALDRGLSAGFNLSPGAGSLVNRQGSNLLGAPYSCAPLSNACRTGSAVTIGAACGRGSGRGTGRAGSFCAVFRTSRFSASMQLLTALGSELCALHQTSVGSAACEPAGRLDCPSNAETAKMALLENRTEASINPLNCVANTCGGLMPKLQILCG